MKTETSKPKYRIFTQFQFNGITYNAGEPVPELPENELKKLISAGKICEVAPDGSNIDRSIKRDKLGRLELSDAEVQVLSPHRNWSKFLKFLGRNKLSYDTLLKIKAYLDEGVRISGDNFFTGKAYEFIDEQLEEISTSKEEVSNVEAKR